MGSLGRCLSRGLLRGQLGPSRPPGPRCYGSAPPELQEKTLVLVKPDAVQRRLVGTVIQRFERRGFKLVAMKLLQADRGLLDKHYQELLQKPFYPSLLAYMTSGPVVAMVWEGYNVVRSTRAMVGDTDSAVAAAGTIRGDLSMHISRNVVHASDSVETAQREISFWFQRDELVAWESGDRDYTYGP
ncbi:nucleoside diphosphate kinase, mitochondrial [Melopsittacus undulatus]|uniref:nucleoside diphosphate kinase, mitochondrial n=1 Tax=Melopsittacus undulatus TaxID=13146 RepID=UPI00146AD920|nr:nucleoside diphosphate kinase, mitochondrial [Melopsittacus undulatus]